MSTIGARDLGRIPQKAGTLEMATPYRGGNDRKFQAKMQRAMRQIPPAEAPQERADVPVDHPVAECPHLASHIRSARAARRTERRLDQHRRDARQSGAGLIQEFRSIESLLSEWGYLDGWQLTPRGERLRFVYNELDLLLTESVERGVFEDLTPRSLASLLSCFVFEPRTDERSEPEWPDAVLADRFQAVIDVWEELTALERSHRLAPTRMPDPGVVTITDRWADGFELDDIDIGAMAAGDFVRVSRQLVDLIRQVRDAFPHVAEVASDALRLVDRGVVAAQGVA
jgi:ATP-dependent RNA helicase HelY